MGPPGASPGSRFILTDCRVSKPTRSYRSRDPLRIVGEVTGWTGHPTEPEQVQAMKDHVARLKDQGIAAEDD